MIVVGAVLGSSGSGESESEDGGLVTAVGEIVIAPVPVEDLPVGERERVERWREASEHWLSVDAFQASMAVVSTDRVIDQAESLDLCVKAPQWRTQLEAAAEYVVGYRAVEPMLVAQTPRVYRLEQEATRGLEVVAAIEGECP